MALLFLLEGEKVSLIDSITSIDKVEFQFTSRTIHSGFYRLTLSNNRLLGFIFDNEDVEIETYANNILDSLKILKSESNKIYYEFLLGKSVEKKIVLSYYEFKESCHGDAVKNKKKIKDKKDALLNNLRFFMKIKKELGIDFLFYVPFREEYVKLEDCYKFFDQGDIEEDIDFDQFFWKKG